MIPSFRHLTRILGLRHERGNDFNPHRGGGVTYSPGGDLFRLGTTTA
jgi:hypothetical protein